MRYGSGKYAYGSFDGSFDWSPIKINKSAVKVGEVDSSEDDLNPSDCLVLNYQPREGVPGFEVETRDDMFWVPIAHRTQKHLKTSPTS